MFPVYLVDDDYLILEDISQRQIWRECGFSIAGSAFSSRTALEEITRLRPDVVVCDLKMPGIDGIGLMTELRARGVDCEFIMLSAFASFSDSRDFFKQNGFDYLLKPLDKMELQITLERLARRLFLKSGSDSANNSTRESEDTFDAIMSYVQRNYKQKLTLLALGEMFHLNPNYICNLFAKHCFQTFTGVVTRLRMNEAARLMQNTQQPIKNIATECGYSNYFYFCRVFKEFFSTSPGEYVSVNRNRKKDG